MPEAPSAGQQMAPLSAEAMDCILRRMEATFKQIELSRGSRVSGPKAEMEMMKLFELARDFMMSTLSSDSGERVALRTIFGGDCSRISSVRAVLETTRFSEAAREDRRLSACLHACMSVEKVLGDLGLGITLRRAQETQKKILRRSIIPSARTPPGSPSQITGADGVEAAVEQLEEHHPASELREPFDPMSPAASSNASCVAVDLNNAEVVLNIGLAASEDWEVPVLASPKHQANASAISESPFEPEPVCEQDISILSPCREQVVASQTCVTVDADCKAEGRTRDSEKENHSSHTNIVGVGSSEAVLNCSHSENQAPADQLAKAEQSLKRQLNELETKLSKGDKYLDATVDDIELLEPMVEPEPEMCAFSPEVCKYQKIVCMESLDQENTVLEAPRSPAHKPQSLSQEKGMFGAPSSPVQKILLQKQDASMATHAQEQAESNLRCPTPPRALSPPPLGDAGCVSVGHVTDNPQVEAVGRKHRAPFEFASLSAAHRMLIRELFVHYVGPGGVSAGLGLNLTKFRRLLRDCGLLSQEACSGEESTLSIGDVDLALARASGTVCPGVAPRLRTVAAFSEALVHVAAQISPELAHMPVQALDVLCCEVLVPLGELILQGIGQDVRAAACVLAERDVTTLMRRCQQGLGVIFARYAQGIGAPNPYRRGYWTPKDVSRFGADAGLVADLSHALLQRLFCACAAYEASSGRGEDEKVSFDSFLLALVATAQRIYATSSTPPRRALATLLRKISAQSPGNHDINTAAREVLREKS